MHPLFEKVCVGKYPKFQQLNNLLPTPTHLQKCPLCTALIQCAQYPVLALRWSGCGAHILHDAEGEHRAIQAGRMQIFVGWLATATKVNTAPSHLPILRGGNPVPQFPLL